MPRTYKKKKHSPLYSIEDLQEAVQLVKERKLSQREAASKYKIPKSVIQARFSGKVSLDRKGAGRPTALKPEEENDIVECLLARAKFGYPCDRNELFQLVGMYVKTNTIATVFKDGVPGEDWYLNFMKRHPRLSLKKAEHLQAARQSNTVPEIVYDFYEKLGSLYKEKNLTSPDKACFVFNTDESGFEHDPSRVRGIGEKGKALYRISGGSGRESTTVLGCVSADGATMPPVIVFKGAAVQPRWVSEKAYPGTLYVTSKGGWMEGPVFLNWFKTAFVPHIKNIRDSKEMPDQEVVLIFDGHASHITLDLCKLAVDNKVSLIKLPSHLTDKLQPLDKTIFGPVKTTWDIKLVEYGKTQIGQAHQRLTKQMFSEVLGEVWHLSMTPANIISGFKSTGLFPADCTKFSEAKFNPVELKKYKQKKEEENKKEEERRKRAETGQTEEPTPGPSRPNLQETWSSRESIPHPPLLSQSSLNLEENQHEALPSAEGSQKTPEVGNTANVMTPASTASSKKSVIEIFAETLSKSSKTKTTEKSTQTPTKEIKTRLKPERYGEVLTAQAVMERLEKAEKAKADKEKQKQERKRVREEKTKGKIGKITKTKGKDSCVGAAKENTIKQKSKGKRPVKRALEFSSSSSDSDDISESEMFNAPLSPMEVIGPEVVEYEVPTKTNVKPGSYILVNVRGGYRKTTNYKYVCFVQSVSQPDADDEEYGEGHRFRVTGLRHIDEHATTFALIEKDEFYIGENQILSVLPDPKTVIKDRKVAFVFPGTVEVFEQP